MNTSAIILAIPALLISPLVSAKPSDPQSARSISSSSPRSTTVERLMKMDDRMVILHNGRAIPMTTETVLPNGSRVTLDGILISKSGARQNLPDCTILNADGSRVRDHAPRVVMIDGQMMIMRNGATRRMEMATSLGDGRTATQEGYLLERSGSRHEIAEGTMIVISSERPAPSLDAARNLGATR